VGQDPGACVVAGEVFDAEPLDVEPVARAGALPDAVDVTVSVAIDPWELVLITDVLVVLGGVLEGVTTTTTVVVPPITSLDADGEGIPERKDQRSSTRKRARYKTYSQFQHTHSSVYSIPLPHNSRLRSQHKVYSANCIRKSFLHTYLHWDSIPRVPTRYPGS
jgi:hypothetical protein